MGSTGSKYDLDELQNCIKAMKDLYLTWNEMNEWGDKGKLTDIEVDKNQGATIDEIDEINTALKDTKDAFSKLISTTYKYLKKRKEIIEENEKKAEKSALGE